MLQPPVKTVPREGHGSRALLSSLTAAGLAGVFALTSCSVDRSITSPPEGGARGATEGELTSGPLRTGYILGRNGKPFRVTYEVHDGLAVVEGDILLGKASAIATSADQLLTAPPHVPGGPDFGVVIDGANYRWPGGVVPYEIDPSLPSPSRVTAAIAHIESKTPGVDLVPRTGQVNYVRFIPSTACSSYVGRLGGGQVINLATGCGTGATVHEITHALGLWHEQSRCDRATYVEILWANVQPGKEHNFDIHCDYASDLFGYAEGSIMHYSPYAFSANGQPTLRSLRGLDYLMGQQSGLGTTDVSTINQLYPPKPTPWITRASLPTARKELAAGTASGQLYAIGGVTAAGTVLTTVQAYNASTNTWTTKPPLPAPRWRTNGTATINGILYLAGGVGPTTPGHTKTLYVYNSLTSSWSTKASMPIAGGCGGSGAISGIVYVLVGCDALTSTTSGAKGILLRYDPTANTWSTKAASPTPHQLPAVTAVGGKLYVMGGKNGSGIATNVVHAYSPSTNTWTTKAPLPAARYRSTAQVIAGKIYVVGGNDAAGNYVSTAYVYDPALNKWSTAMPMPTARANLGSGVISNVLHVVGGQNPSAAVLGTTEAFTP